MVTNTHASPAKYLWIWVWLAGLMLLGVLLSRFHISKSLIVGGVLFLSTIKAILVASYYMHLKFDGRVARIVAIAPLVIIAVAVLLLASSRLVRL